MTRSLACILMLLASGSQAYNSIDSERYIKALVDVFNGLFVDDALYFYTDFGSASTLLNNNGDVKLGGPIQLLSTSKEDLGNMTMRYTARLKGDSDAITFRGLCWSFRGCSVVMHYEVAMKSFIINSGKPISLSVENCASIQPCRGPIPDHPEQVLPALADGLLSAAKENLSLNGHRMIPRDVPGSDQRGSAIAQLMDYAVTRMAPEWLPPQ